MHIVKTNTENLVSTVSQSKQRIARFFTVGLKGLANRDTNAVWTSMIVADCNDPTFPYVSIFKLRT